ncbi:Inositol phosphosphingolipids phospholipase C [Escovopsis weberi]|uniref:Inositol phosphosphingolipids phospholipase C n=1 Tax=Escovopsis weberi TaxID=150374 RepID=A0A0N0RSV8_ESCWE|nr:Inositol phosphosphingolipids phospholipase C [Escovopsis weberi]
MSTIIQEKEDLPGPSPSPSPSRTLPKEINLLTLNCWGLLHISALRRPRLLEIGRQIALMRPPPDIVCLQECWSQEDFLAIRHASASALPHAKFYFAGAFGAGLAILSRWPLEASSMVRYGLNGRPTAFWRGDWYVGKGVACATVRFGPGEHDLIEVFNTHTHAPYESGPGDSYICHRISQAWQLSSLLRAAALSGRLTLALGDFNMLPRSLQHRIITARAPVRDTWRVLHPDSALGPAACPDERARRLPIPSADFNLRANGATSDTVYNTWRWPKDAQRRLAESPCPVDPATPDPRGKRLDYVFASTAAAPSSSSSSSSPRSGWVVKSAHVAMTQRHPDLNVSLSDHFAVFTTLAYHTTGTGTGTGTDKGTISPLDAQLLSDPSGDHQPLPCALYDEILATIISYTARETRQQSLRAFHFYAALLVWIACLVAVWFSPRNYVAFLLLLVGSLSLVAGVVDGLLALLFFSTELRALKEFEWEIRNARSLAPEEGLVEKSQKSL